MDRYWSGRRESNPRMQLGKLTVSQGLSELSCKTGQFSHPNPVNGLQAFRRTLKPPVMGVRYARTA